MVLSAGLTSNPGSSILAPDDFLRLKLTSQAGDEWLRDAGLSGGICVAGTVLRSLHVGCAEEWIRAIV